MPKWAATDFFNDSSPQPTSLLPPPSAIGPKHHIMTTNHPNRGLATNQQGRLPTDDLPPGADMEGVEDNEREKKSGMSRPPFRASFGPMVVGRHPPVSNLQAPPERPMEATDVAVTDGTIDQLRALAQPNDGAAEQGRDSAGTAGSPNPADYQPPIPIPCPFCWAKVPFEPTFLEVDMFVR